MPFCWKQRENIKSTKKPFAKKKLDIQHCIVFPFKSISYISHFIPRTFVYPPPLHPTTTLLIILKPLRPWSPCLITYDREVNFIRILNGSLIYWSLNNVQEIFQQLFSSYFFTHKTHGKLETYTTDVDRDNFSLNTRFRSCWIYSA